MSELGLVGAAGDGDGGLPLFRSVEGLAGVPLERLEHEMLSLSGHIAAATCSLLLMVGEYDARNGWESWESYSCAHWLNWRCGVGMVAAREQVRVARCLRGLPVVVEAFSAGEISYSKVRAITRVAHGGNEAELVEMARFATAAQMERAVSRLRRAVDPEAVTDDEECSQRLRSLRWCLEVNGDLVVRARIPAGEAADVFRSQIAARLVTEAAEGEELEDLDARRLDAFLDGLAAGVSVESSLASQPEAVVHVTLEVPAGGLVATGGDDRAADDRAGDERAVGQGAEGFRSDDSAVSPPWSLPNPAAPDAAASGPGREAPDREVSESDDGERSVRGQRVTAAELRRLEVALRGSVWPFVTGSGAQVSQRRARALVCDAGVRAVFDLIDAATGEVTSVDLGRHDRVPNRRLRRQVMRRDRGCCRFPGCSRRHRLHVHHIVWWEHGGLTEMSNLLLLCPKHHHAVHDRRWELTGTADDHTFRRPDGVVSDPSAALLSGSVAELVDRHRRFGLDVVADGAGSHWSGDRIDWDCFFAAFANGRLAHDPADGPYQPYRPEPGDEDPLRLDPDHLDPDGPSPN